MEEFTKDKAVAAAIGAAVTALQQVLMDNVFNVDHWISLVTSIILLGLTVYTVWKVPNKKISEVSNELGGR